MSEHINVLCLGDVFGRPGRRLVRDLLPGLIHHHQVDLVVANGENASGGLGLTIDAATELFAAGVDVLTSGNHIYKHREICDYLDRTPRIIRPANYPVPAPGRGATVVDTPAGVRVGILNLLGRVFMEPLDCPFQTADRELPRLKDAGAQVIVVDMHAEATSEKMALGWFLDGRVAAVVGTHTHVQTADETIFPGGTAFLTDLGMTGPHRSIIGVRVEAILDRFRSGRPQRHEVAKRGLRLEGALIRAEVAGGHAKKIERIQIVADEPKKNQFT